MVIIEGSKAGSSVIIAERYKQESKTYESVDI